MLLGQFGVFGGQQSAGLAQPFLQWPGEAPPAPLELLLVVELEEALELDAALELDVIPVDPLLVELALTALLLEEDAESSPDPVPEPSPHPAPAPAITPSEAMRIRIPLCCTRMKPPFLRGPQ